MDRYYSKYEYAVKRPEPKRGKGWIWLGLLLVIGVASFLTYQHVKANPNAGAPSFVSGIKNWFAKTNRHQPAEATKKSEVAENPDDASQIHFEFYKTLPTAQVPVPDTSEEKEAKVVKANPTPKKKVEIANAAELERELSMAAGELQNESEKRK